MENYGENLDVVYGNQRSFYGKAKVREIQGVKILRSYETDVAAIDSHGEIHRLWGGEYITKDYGMWGVVQEFTEWTATTGKHIREFALQNGYEDFRKADYLNLPVEELSVLIAIEARDRAATKTRIA